DHSFNFLAAVAMLDGAFGLAQFENERWNAAAGRGVMERLEIVCDPSLNPRSPGGFPCAIRAKGTDGKDYAAEVLDPPGFARHGLDADAVLHKFHAVTGGRLPKDIRERLVEAAMSIDHSTDLSPLTAAL